MWYPSSRRGIGKWESWLEADVAEQGVLSRIRELKAAGYTTRQIADELNRQACLTRRGRAWRFQWVAEALRAA